MTSSEIPPPTPHMPGTSHGRKQDAYRFSKSTSAWTPSSLVPPVAPPPIHPLRLRLTTLNVLKNDAHNENLLCHDLRYSHILDELESLDADIVGLNEVTAVFLKKAMATPWIRERYYLSVVLGSLSCKRLSTVRGGGSFGNLIMSKLPLDYVEYVNSGSGRHSHAAQFTLGSHKVKVCSTHLIAAPYINEGKRKRELQRLTASLGMHDGTVVIMGDFNFHREAENSSIPEGWSEVPAVVSLGTTWSFARNKMLAHYLPLRNLYNGLGLGASFGWPSEMRLDRLLIKGDNLDNDNAEARLFANEPIHERGKDRPALPQSGPELREKHRNMPWEEFLFPSDHFGIVVDIPAK